MQTDLLDRLLSDAGRQWLRRSGNALDGELHDKTLQDWTRQAHTAQQGHAAHLQTKTQGVLQQENKNEKKIKIH